MPSLTERSRNNIRAGVFVSVALVLFLTVVIILTDALTAFGHATEKYTVTFDVASGVANLKKGSEVRVGGVRMGKVTGVIPQVEKDQPFRKIDVEFKLDRDITLYSNARVLVSAPIIGNDAWLDIPNVGDAQVHVPPGGHLQGTSSVGMLTAILGSENAATANEVVQNVKAFSAFLAQMDQEYDTRVVPVLKNIEQITGDAGAVLAEIRQTQWPNWAAAVDHVMTWATQATAKLDAAIAHGDELLVNSNAIVVENREPIRSAIGNVQSATERFNNETIDKFHLLMDSGQRGMDSAADVLQSLQRDYPAWSGNVAETLAHANLASQQLKLTLNEVRRAPWKILYRPTAEEVQHELLYDATRAFAVAAAELRMTSDSVKRIFDAHGEKISSDQGVFSRLEQNIADSLANYEKAQQRMLEVLILDGQKH